MVASPLALKWDQSLKERVGSSDNSVPTHQITSSLIVKSYSSVERVAMDYVRRHTRIPVPQPRYGHLRTWMVSEFIEGEMLLKC